MRTADQRSGGLTRRVPLEGFSLIELVFATAISTVIVMGIAVTFTVHSRVYRNQRLVREMQQSLRHGMDAIVRDVRMAGYGIPVPDSQLASWVTWESGMTNNPLVVQGATTSAPDRVTIAAAFEMPVAALTSAVPAGSTVLTLGSGEAARLNTMERKIVFVGRNETARIVGIMGDQVTISTHPLTAGRGLAYGYPAGTPVESVETVTYSCRPATNAFPYQPLLIRDVAGGGGGTNWWTKAVAEGIEDMQIVRSGYGYRVSLTARTREPDPTYRHPQKGDGYRRMTLAAEVLPRNSALLRLRE